MSRQKQVFFVQHYLFKKKKNTYRKQKILDSLIIVWYNDFYSAKLLKGRLIFMTESAVSPLLDGSMPLLVLTALFYAVCTVSDKFSISEYRLSSGDFTFLVALSSCVFMLPALFYSDLVFKPDIGSAVTILLVTADKIVEFSAAAAVLKKLSGFETKAWLGTALFLSYFSDIFLFGEEFKALKLVFIFITCGCLALMVKNARSTEKDRYKKIWIILIFYILSKYFYGIIIKAGSGSISPLASVYASMVIISAVYLFKSDLKGIFGEKRRGTAIVFFTRIPNTAGLVLENILIGRSLTMYSLEQPLILAMLLIYSFIRRENTSKVSIISGALCLLAIFAFKIF